MTVVSLLELTIKPESIEAAPAVLTETLRATRDFAGSLGVDVTIDENDPAHVMVVERWESIEADDAYRAFRLTPEGANDLGSVLAGPPVLVRYEVADGV